MSALATLATAEFRVPVEILDRSSGLTPSGAQVVDWRPAARVWVKVDQVEGRLTGEAAADRGAKASVSLVLVARWFEGWEDALSPSRRLEIEGRSYNLRSVVEAPGEGTERVLRITAQAVVS